ncbi:MAG: 30S ribosomal protein S6e [Candidatus Bathyarchaeia archaeon]
MAKFKIIVSDPETGKSNVVELEGNKATPLIGRRIGEDVDGAVVGLPRYKLLITGGSDKDGFPMKADVHGGVKSKILLGQGAGLKPREKGERRRKMIRGNTITDDIIQINMKIVEKPQKTKETKTEPEKSN